ncbi:hypothetical protein F5Y12DRAFT_742313 [Xylaria sp. FL1777]|nr:hypothetical protein F5Y12DRAFT_742313 [Xylaria sp. FL1777]
MTPSTTRLLAKTTSKLSALSLRPNPQSTRAFSQTCRRREDEQPPAPRPSLLSRLAEAQQQQQPPPGQAPAPTPTPSSSPQSGGMSDIQRVFATNTMARAMSQPVTSSFGDATPTGEDWGSPHEPFHFHIYAHKHNTHITVTKPNRNAIVSMSAGNLGFRKSKRGTYDAAYQLCAHILDKLNQGGWHHKIKSLEIVLRGFGAGREAASKVLLGSEGRLLRPYIKKVSDDTKLKFGGTRSPRPKRLG